MILNRVDLPHPDGPTMVMNSPLETERSSDLITSVEPNDLEILLSPISAIILLKMKYPIWIIFTYN
jgi:hypothetical protein